MTGKRKKLEKLHEELPLAATMIVNKNCEKTKFTIIVHKRF
jgi:hypothetical protein